MALAASSGHSCTGGDVYAGVLGDCDPVCQLGPRDQESKQCLQLDPSQNMRGCRNCLSIVIVAKIY